MTVPARGRRRDFNGAASEPVVSRWNVGFDLPAPVQEHATESEARARVHRPGVDARLPPAKYEQS